ncbi:MAG: LysR family transcriptional regulator [Delftia acidovorans]|nr:LysR family transcriptional regulator [Delftia acidovorans]
MAMHLSLTDLRLFMAVAQTQNLTQAAQLCHLSTAAASARIRALEGQADCLLLQRMARGVRLTPAGEAFAQHARLMLRESQLLAQQLKQYAGGLQGHVNILANTTACTELMPSVLARFLADHQQVSVRLKEGGNAEVVRAVREGRADLGVLAGDLDFSGLRAWCFAEEKIVAVLPAAHAWAGRAGLSFLEVMEQPFIALNTGASLRDFLWEKAASMGLAAVQPRVEVGSFEAMSLMVEAGIGLAIAGESVMRRYMLGHRIALVPLTDAWSLRRRYVVIRDARNHPAYLEDLVDSIHQAKGDGQGFSGPAGCGPQAPS